MSNLYAELGDEKYETPSDRVDSLIIFACDSNSKKYCDNCKYYSSDASIGCILYKIKRLVKQALEISNQNRYVIIAKSLRIYGPTSKEECEKMAKTLENVEIRELDPHEIDA
jgi:hypothetical protein